MSNSNATTRKANLSPTSEATKLRVHIAKIIAKEIGEEEYKKLHYLVKEKLMEEYEMKHQEELQKLFPNASL